MEQDPYLGVFMQAESDIEEEMAEMESADEDEDERPLAEVCFFFSCCRSEGLSQFVC